MSGMKEYRLTVHDHWKQQTELEDTSKLCLKTNLIMTLRGGGGEGHDANFSLNLEPS